MKDAQWELPGGPVVRTAKGTSGQGTKILQATWCGQKKKKRKKRCSTSLIIKMQIKTTTKYHFTPPLGQVLLKNPKQTNKQKRLSVGEDVEEVEPLCTIGGNVKWCSGYGKLYGDSSKIIKNKITI